MTPTTRIVRFGSYEFDLRRSELRRAGLHQRLPPQPSRLLGLLILNAGRVVTREEIQQHLWADGTIVDFEGGINHSIRQIRTALRDDAATARFVQTVPRVGYRFFAGIEEVAAETPETAAAPVHGGNGSAPTEAGPGAAGEAGPVRPAAGEARERPFAGPGPVQPPPTAPEGSRGGPRTGPPGAPGSRSRRTLPLVALLAAVAGLLLAVASQSRPPAVSAFERMELTRLTGQVGVWSAVVSPDGRSFAYSHFRDGGFALILKSTSTDHARPLLEGLETPIRHIRFSRDGDYLYYLRPEHLGPGYSVLYRVAKLGGPPEKLIFDVDSGVDESPDQERLAFVRGYPQRGEGALVIASRDGASEDHAVVRGGPERILPVTPAWHPGGRRIAVVAGQRTARPPWRIDLIDPADGGSTPLGSSRWDRIDGIVWAPDGRALLITAEAPGAEDRSQIWRVSYPDGEVARVSNDLNTYAGLSPITTRGSAVTVLVERRSNLWSLAPEGERNARGWTNGSRPQDRVLHVQSGTDGSVLYTTRDADRFRLWRIAAPGEEPASLLPDNAGIGAHFDVSREDGSIVFTSRGQAGVSHIFRLPPEGGTPVQITDGGGERAPAICSGGGRVYFVRTGERGLWSVLAKGGEARRISELHPYSTAPVCSPDGTRLAFGAIVPVGERYDRMLVVIPASGGKPLHRMPWPAGGSLRWSPDGRALSFSRTGDGGAEIHRVDLSSGQVELVLDGLGGTVFSFDWSEDGNRLFLSRGNTRSEAVLIRELV